jgi:SAM-dependent methyltransferase
MMRWVVEQVYPDGLAGRSFLDCGCNAGGHAFGAVALGAGRSYAFDARQFWLDQAAFLANHIDAPQITFAKHELADLPALGLEPFDVTLFGGLFYHLPDPVAGLKIAADLTRELLIVNTSAKPGPGKALQLNRESATQVLSGVDGLAWLPTGPEVMQDILAWCGFPHVRVDFNRTPNEGRGWRRLQIFAARDAATFGHYDRVRPDAMLVEDEKPEAPSVLKRLLRKLR